MDMKDKKDQTLDNSPIKRRDFFRRLGSIVAGGAILGMGGVGVSRVVDKEESSEFWQIDPNLCTQCGRCETHCVMPVSAVRCVHAVKVCGYCDLCGGYYRTNAKELNTAAENMICPTGAIHRKFVEDPYFEYTIDEDLCNGCGKCVKGCNSFGNGSLYLQIKQDLCLNCNECKISTVCASNAIKRVSYGTVYYLKEHA
jgi:electron transport complex protein RnfB